MDRKETYIVRLTADEIKLVRDTIKNRHQMVKNYPLEGDGDLAKRLAELDKPFHATWQCVYERVPNAEQ